MSATVGPQGAISSRTRLDVPDSVGDRVRELSNEKELTAVPPYTRTPVWPWVLIGIALAAFALSVVRG